MRCRLVSVAVLATRLVLAALVVFERTGDSRERSVVTPAESQFDLTTAVVQPPSVVIEEQAVSVGRHEVVQLATQSPQQGETEPSLTKATSPPSGTSWASTSRSYGQSTRV